MIYSQGIFRILQVYNAFSVYIFSYLDIKIIFTLDEAKFDDTLSYGNFIFAMENIDVLQKTEEYLSLIKWRHIQFPVQISWSFVDASLQSLSCLMK